MVSEKERAKIHKEAQGILMKFSHALKKIPDTPISIDKGLGFREEEAGKECEEDFRERIFSNAPNKQKDCIVGEKGKWID